MKKNTLMLGIGVVLVLAVIAVMLILPGAGAPASSGKLTVVASFYPMYDFAKNVGGDRVSVSVLIPPGVEPHEYELSPSDARKLSDADVFIYNGAGMEPWVPNLLEGVGNSRLIAVDASRDINFTASQDPDQPGNDPHVWLDPVLAKKQVEAIRDAFIAADPAGRSYYEANAAAYSAKLDALDAEFRAMMLSCRKRDILITHATLAYFCREYGCHQIAIEGVNPEAEPQPADLANIITQARQHNVTTVFVEKLMNPQSAETIASEINGTVSVFNSVHGLTVDEQAQGEDYISLMHDNVQIIKTALNCS